jgi:2-polyprenyl-3-methyl-5-hydroxy-6-metoxy-1,4-benzoquinol methylase
LSHEETAVHPDATPKEPLGYSSLRDHEAWNEDMAHRYNPDAFITKSGILIRTVEARRLAMTKNALACGPRDVVLDLGCGAGNLLPKLQGSRIVGVDLSDMLLAQAKARVEGKAHIELKKAPAEQLPYPDNTFDRVVCSEVLEHVLDPKVVLKEIRRVAKAGARVVLTVPNEELINATKRVVLALGLKKWIAGDYEMSDNMLDEWHKTEISKDWVVDACRDDFKFIGAQSVPVPLFAYHRILIFQVAK